jgi:hypothetical protein
MRWRWFVPLGCLAILAGACATDFQREYEKKAAPNFLFEKRPFHFDCTERYPGEPLPLPRVEAFPQIPYSYTRLETLDLPQPQVPALTLAAENGARSSISRFKAPRRMTGTYDSVRGAKATARQRRAGIWARFR